MTSNEVALCELADEERRSSLAQVRAALVKLDELREQLGELELELSDVEPLKP